MTPESFRPPWKMKPLDEWAIVGMNHYHVDGVRHIFVAMIHQSRDGRYIQREGPDLVYIWNQLAHDATKLAGTHGEA